MLLSLETDTLELKKKPKIKPNKPNKHKAQFRDVSWALSLGSSEICLWHMVKGWLIWMATPISGNLVPRCVKGLSLQHTLFTFSFYFCFWIGAKRGNWRRKLKTEKLQETCTPVILTNERTEGGEEAGKEREKRKTNLESGLWEFF